MLLSDIELEGLSNTKLLDMILKLSKAIEETKSMQDKNNDGHKLYLSLEIERRRRKLDIDGSQKTMNYWVYSNPE